jgi:SAM-dependent methyltransferase
VARPSLKATVPARLRRRLRAELGLDELRERVNRLEAHLQERIDRLESQLHESRDDAWERSRARWRDAKPTRNLTWEAEVSGDGFIDKAEGYGAVAAGRAILEVGPGYGRLLATCLERGIEFGSYLGVDLSADNVAHLRERFSDDRVRFLEADVESVRLETPVDAVIASLTFKHLFPSFEAALANLAPQLSPGGIVLFDLIEGDRRYFEDDGVTYIRWYTRPEIERVLRTTGLELIAFDEVRHLPEMPRLLVAARRPEGK